MILGGWAFSYERGTPVLVITVFEPRRFLRGIFTVFILYLSHSHRNVPISAKETFSITGGSQTRPHVFRSGVPRSPSAPLQDPIAVSQTRSPPSEGENLAYNQPRPLLDPYYKGTSLIRKRRPL